MAYKLVRTYKKGRRTIYVVNSKVPGRAWENGLHLNATQFRRLKQKHKRG